MEFEIDSVNVPHNWQAYVFCMLIVIQNLLIYICPFLGYHQNALFMSMFTTRIIFVCLVMTGSILPMNSVFIQNKLQGHLRHHNIE